MSFGVLKETNGGFVASRKNIIKLLKKAGVGLALLPYKADGATKGINGPFVNPWVDVANAVKKNLFDTNAPYTSIGTATKQLIPNGIKIVGNPVGQVSYVNIPYSLLPNTQYRIQAIETVINGSSRIGVRNSLGAGIGDLLVTGSIAFTTDETGNGIFYIYANRDILTASTEVNYTNIQLELGTTATTYEPYAKNNALLTNFAGTISDGWVDTLLPNGNTKPMLKLDGLNSYGILPNNPAIDIVGLDEFEIAKCFMTGATVNYGCLYAKELDGVTGTTQLAIVTMVDGRIYFVFVGGSIFLGNVGSLLPNTVYILVIRRKLGRLICYLNAVEIYNQPNVSNFISRPNVTIGARSNITDGSTKNTFSNVFDGGMLLTRNPSNWDALDKATKESFRGYL